MGVEMLHDPSQLRGRSYAKAKLYGMPHIGCRYRSYDMGDTKLDGEYPRCACCGRTNGRHNVHHEPPRSHGSFLLETPLGSWKLLPALIDLCGSGTEGCHGMRHANRLQIRWEWDSDEHERKWWGGWFLSHGYLPHDPRLYAFGRYVFELDGSTWDYRGQ